MYARLIAIASILLVGSAVFAADTASDASDKVAATRVTLHVKDVLAQEALEKLQKAANVTFLAQTPQAGARLKQAHVTIDADAQPFWSVLTSICDAAGVRPIRFLPGAPGIALADQDGAWAIAYTAVDGPFVIALTKIDEERRLTYGGKGTGARSVYTLNFEVAVEPALAEKFQSAGPLQISQCVDQDGFVIPTNLPPTMFFGQRPPLTLGIQAHSDSATKISELKGTCTFVVAVAPKHVDVPDVMAAHDVAVDAGNCRLQIKQLQKEGRQYVLRVVVLQDQLNNSALDEIVKAVSRSKPIFLDASKKDMGFALVNARPSAVPFGTLITMSFNPTVLQDPKSMSWDIPTSLLNVRVPFDFKDVPLPVLPPPTIDTPNEKKMRPAIALAPATDYAAEVAKILPQLSGNAAQEREDALVRLDLLLPHGFDAIDAASKRDGLAETAHAALVEFVDRNRPLQAARLRRAKVIADERLWDEQNALQTYGQFGKHDPKWDAQVAKAVHLFCQSNNNFSPDARQPFEAALEAGCDDPMIVSMAAWIVENSNADPRQVLKLYEQADADFGPTRYPATRKIWNTIRYTSLLRRTSSAEAIARAAKFLDQADSKKLNFLRSEMLNQWQQTPRDGAPPGRMLAIALRLISITKAAPSPLEPLYDRVAPVLEKACAGRPEPLVFRGTFYTDWAWEARGDDTGDKVTKPGWKFFAERLQVAEDALTKAYQIDPTDPAAATQMVIVELGQGKGKDVMEKWFKRAMEADPGNYIACSHKLYYLEPKWYGSPQEMLAFGQECLRGGDYCSDLPMILADVHRSLSAYLPQREIYFIDPAVWRDIQHVYEPILRVKPDDSNARSAYCYYACMCGHWAVAAKQFEILGDKVDVRYFANREDMNDLRKKAKLRSTPQDSL